MSRVAGSSRFHAVLLAGGSGTRFWPMSRGDHPKQFLPLAGERPLIVDTWRRLRKLAPPDRVWVVSPASLVRQVRRLLPELRPRRIIEEPSPRDTGAAVMLGTSVVERADPGAVVGIFPTDHVIRDVRAFRETVRVAIEEARSGRLVCLGIRPDRPATGFGYLACSEVPTPGRAVRVRRFVEKPEAARARRFLRSGKYLWNGGMFVWDAARFREEASRTAPRVFRAVENYLAGTKTAWGRAPRISVDYAVMERAREVSVVPLEAGWDDLGSWDAAARIRGGRKAAHGGPVLVDSPESVVFGDERLVALVDVPGVAVIDTPDALLVVSRKSSERVKRVVKELRRRGREDLL